MPLSPLVSPLLFWIIGILAAVNLWDAVIGLFLLWGVFNIILSQRKFAVLRTFILGIVLSGVAFFWTQHLQPSPVDEASLKTKNEYDLKLSRVTVKNVKKGRTVSGFAVLKSVSSNDVSVYFTLKLPESMAMPYRGEVLRVNGVLRPAVASRSDFEYYLDSVGVHFLLQQGEVISVRSSSCWKKFIGNLRTRCGQLLQIGLENRPNSLYRVYQAMLLGNRSQMSPEEKQIYSRTGVAHLFAVSGLHVGVIAGFLTLLTRPFCRYRVTTFFCRLSVLWLFVEIAGASPSAIRAFFMITCFWVAPLLYRKSNAFSALIVAASATLVVSPMSILDTGFQLSYSIVTSLILYGVPLGRTLYALLLRPCWRLPKVFRYPICRALKRLTALFGLSISATLPLIPISIFHFKSFSLGGIFLNPLAIPLASFILILGFVSLLFGGLQLVVLSGLLNGFADGLLQLLHKGIHWVATCSWVEVHSYLTGVTVMIWWEAVLLMVLYYLYQHRLFQLQFFTLAAGIAIVPIFLL